MHPAEPYGVARQDNDARRHRSTEAYQRCLSFETIATGCSAKKPTRLLRFIGKQLRPNHDRPSLDHSSLPRDRDDPMATQRSMPDDFSEWGATETISFNVHCTGRFSPEVTSSVMLNSAPGHLEAGPPDIRRVSEAQSAAPTAGSRMAVIDPTVLLEPLVPGVKFANRYTIDEEKPRGRPQCRYATDGVTSRRVLLKFYFDAADEWTNAARIHRRTQQSKYVCRLLDVIVDADGFPPCLVLERGNYSLAERLAAGHPNSMEQRAIVYSILEALEYLHSHHVTHGNLSPSNIMWFSSDFCWKLVELDYASPIEDKAMVPPFLSRYAAPELIMAFHNRRHQVRLRPAADMWSVGVIAFEVFTDSRVCESRRLRDVIKARLDAKHSGHGKGQRWLSADPRGRTACGDEEQQLMRFLQRLIRVAPFDRRTASNALTDPIFRSATDTYHRINVFESPQSNSGIRLADIFYWPEGTWLQMLNDHLSVTLQIERFSKKSDPEAPFHSRAAKEALQFRDASLSGHPVHLLRKGRNARLRLGVEPDAELTFPIEGIVTVCAQAPDEEFIELETVQSRQGKTVEALAALHTANLRSKKRHVATPHSDKAERKYVKLTVRIRLLLGAPFRREVDLERLLYCKIVHSRHRMRLHRWAGGVL